MARDTDAIDYILLAALFIWNEARQARLLAGVSAAAATQDPLSWDGLKKKVVDNGIDLLIQKAIFRK